MSDVGVSPEPGARFDVFLSYNSRDRAAVERIARRLKGAGLEPWLDVWSLTPGGQWQGELGAGLDASTACAVLVGPHDIGAWELQEVAVAIDRAAGERGFRVFPVLLPGVDEPFDPNRLPHFLRTRTWVDFRAGLDDRRALQDLVNAVGGVPFGPDVPVSRDAAVVPYRGLQPFGEEDAEFYFGRDREIQRLLEKLKHANRFVAVLGASGTGKSSLVRAGLVPRLRAGALPEVDEWRFAVLRPGASPLTALAAQIAKLGGATAMRATLDDLAEDPRTLHLAVELALADSPPGERVLVIVDQLEEVFTLCRDEAERGRLFATLLYASSAPGGRTVVVVTMRADFYARCSAYPDLAQLISDRQLLVGPMSPEGLRQAIEEPARRVGLELEAGLSDTILAEVVAAPGALPLLEHALLELWERRRGDMLTLEGFRETGGVEGALAQRAEGIFAALGADQQRVARRVLLRLTQPGEGTEDTRRRATRAELAPAGGEDVFELVLGRLVDARMLTTGRDETAREIVDVSHEALIRGWPRLRGWIDADRAGLLLQRRLSAAAGEWEVAGREPGALYRGGRLAAAREWAADHRDDFSDLERDFLAVSDATERGEIRAARRRTRRMRALASGLAVLSVAVIALAIWALGQRATADRRAARATSLALASSATSLLHTRPDISLALAFESYRASPLAEARDSAIRAFAALRDPGVRAVLHGQAGGISAIASSRDGRTLASGADDGTIQLWDVRTRRPLGPPVDAHAHGIDSLAFSPDGRMLASGADGVVRFWDARTLRQIGRPLATGRLLFATTLAFAPDGGTLAFGRDSNDIRLWNVRTRKPLGALLRGHTGTAEGVAFSPDGHMLASAGWDKTVRLWNLRTHAEIGAPLRGHTAFVRLVAFSPDSRLLASTGDDKTIRVWDVRRRRQVGAPLRGPWGDVVGMAFSPDGPTLAITSHHDIRLLDLRTRRQIGAPLTGHTDDTSGVAFGRDGHTLMSASADGTIRVWDLPLPKPPTPQLGDSTSPSVAVALSRDARTLLRVPQNKPLELWDVRTRKRLGGPSVAADNARAALSGDGRVLAFAGDGNAIRFWDVRARKPLGTPLQVGGDPGLFLTLNENGRTLARVRDDNSIELWDVRRHRRLGARMIGHRDLVGTVAFSPDGRMLASGSWDRTVRLWDARTGAQLGRPLRGHTDAVGAVAFSPDGRMLASVGADNTIRLWDTRTNTQVGDPLRVRAATSVAFSSAGPTLASAGGSDVRLWDVRTHEQLGAPLPGMTLGTRALAFGRDGRTLVFASEFQALRTWDRILWRNVRELAADVCGLVGGGLSRAEWTHDVGALPYRNGCD